jgi:hypothetical protein
MESDINPMQAAKRCTAHSKRTGEKCLSPAVSGWSVCRMHGAGGGAPDGERNGNFSHGRRTKAARAERACLRQLLSDSRKFIAALASN